MLKKKLSDVQMIDFLKERHEGNKLCFATFLIGRLVGMGFCLKNPEKARAMVNDFFRFVRVFDERGKDALIRIIESEILEEVYSEIERLKNTI